MTRTSWRSRHSRGVRSSVQHTMLTVSTVMSSRNQGVEKTLKRPSGSKTSTSASPTGGRTARCRPRPVHGRQLDRVAGRVVGRGDRELAHEHAHQSRQRQQRDEHDREADVGEQAPGGAPSRAAARHACQQHGSVPTPARPADAQAASWRRQRTSTSARRSSTSSRPTEMRTRPGGMPGRRQLRLVELAMRGRGRMDRVGDDAAERGRHGRDAQPVDEGRGARPASRGPRASMPPPARSCRCATSAWGWLGRPG